MSRSKLARTATGVPALALAAGLTLTACGPAHPGAAATVGSTRVSVSDLNTAVAQVVKTPDANGQLPDRPTAVLSSLTQIIRDDLIADAAKAKGVTVSEEEIQSLLAKERLTNGSDQATAKANGIPFTGLHAAVYQALLLNKLITALAPGETDQTAQSAALTDYLGKIATQEGVSVNPRYGAWQATQFDVVAGDAFTSPESPAPAASG